MPNDKSLPAKVVMLQGTASSVGKSLMTAALCRIYAERGLRVAPFKAQNMALNSFVTQDGHEIGRSQAVQAQAAGSIPTVHMNPILLKPEAGNRCQVVVHGRPVRNMDAVEYHHQRSMVTEAIRESLEKIRGCHDLVVIEGAGSPVEMNLKDRDIANMFVADLADAKVILVGDIDRGGIFASLVGTMELFSPKERRRVEGFVINKFRGDPARLGNGLDFLTERTGVPVLGVVPHIDGLALPDEDSTSLPPQETHVGRRPNDIQIVAIRYPHMSNYDDLLALQSEPGVDVRFVQRVEDIGDADVLILPGSKSTMADLGWLQTRGLDVAVREHAQRGGFVLGICGGCQMLGTEIDDPYGIEGEAQRVDGLGLLELSVRYSQDKVTAQVVFRAECDSILSATGPMRGYEIHMGNIVARGANTRAPFRILEQNRVQADVVDGGQNARGNVLGTMIHGTLDNDNVRSALLRRLRNGRTVARNFREHQMAELDRLADTVREHISLELVDRIIGGLPDLSLPIQGRLD